MGEDFQVGDVVVCVDASPTLRARCPLREGMFYRVKAIASNCTGLIIDGPAAVNQPFAGWSRTRFRKLPKADEDFTASLRACKPSHNRVPA